MKIYWSFNKKNIGIPRKPLIDTAQSAGATLQLNPRMNYSTLRYVLRALSSTFLHGVKLAHKRGECGKHVFIKSNG